MLPKINTGLDTSDLLDYLADFISMGKSEYGDGMTPIAIAYLNREKSIRGRCAFFDPYYVDGDVRRLNEQLAGQQSPLLLTSSIDVYGDPSLAPSNNRLTNLFKNTLNAISYAHKTFDKIVIPIGCHEPGKLGHNICVALEKAEVGYRATIIDQMGEASYKDTKTQIIQNLRSVGVANISYNRYPMSPNRHDCATFVSFCCDWGYDGRDFRELIEGTDRHYVRYGHPAIPPEIIDGVHWRDRDLLFDSADRLATNFIAEHPYELAGYSPRGIVCQRVMKYRQARVASFNLDYLGR